MRSSWFIVLVPGNKGWRRGGGRRKMGELISVARAGITHRTGGQPPRAGPSAHAHPAAAYNPRLTFPPSSSPKMHPLLHMSTEKAYLVDPSKISGALYHRVAT